jgi:hypothetical protein
MMSPSRQEVCALIRHVGTQSFARDRQLAPNLGHRDCIARSLAKHGKRPACWIISGNEWGIPETLVRVGMRCKPLWCGARQQRPSRRRHSVVGICWRYESALCGSLRGCRRLRTRPGSKALLGGVAGLLAVLRRAIAHDRFYLPATRRCTFGA